jgi:hypothetical protein
MRQHVPLKRQFEEIGSEEIGSEEHDTTSLAEVREQLGQSVDWSHVLAVPRVVVLAEALSGKTHEMKQQCSELRSAGHCAFFVPLEELPERTISDLLNTKDSGLFERWLGSDQPAYFFLDAVDELKLRRNTLEKALNRFVKDIRENFHRAHVVISSRPSDWDALQDMEILRDRLPWNPPKKLTAVSAQESEELFLEVLKTPKVESILQSNAESVAFKAFQLLRLTRAQITTFANSQLPVTDFDSFIEAIESEDAWVFLCRPGDLSRALARWKTDKKLGSFHEQIEIAVDKNLRPIATRPDAGYLTTNQARDAVQKLALAIVLARKRTLQTSDCDGMVGAPNDALDPAEVLTDFTEDQRRALLRLPIFDPATLGRVQFHHRTVSEYLAAKELSRMRSNQCLSDKQLFTLLLSEQYGITAAIPSRRPITAWLAMMDKVVYKKILEIDPLVLFAFGDPGSYCLEQRKQILQRFVSQYGKATLSLSVPSDALRIAKPDLVPTIREQWTGEQLSESVRDLFVWMAYANNLVGLENEMLEEAPRDTGNGRRIAAYLVRNQCSTQIEQLLASVISGPEKFPSSDIFLMIAELVIYGHRIPELIGVAPIGTAQNKYEPQLLISSLRCAIESGKISPQHFVAVRDALTAKILELPEALLPWAQHPFFYAGAAELLSLLCLRQISDQALSDEFLRAFVVSCSNRPRTSESQIAKDLKDLIRERTSLRPRIFSLALELIDQRSNKARWNGWDSEIKWRWVNEITQLGGFDKIDLEWLLDVRSNADAGEILEIALHGLIDSVQQSKLSQQELDDFVGADSKLLVLVDERLKRREKIEDSEFLKEAREEQQTHQNARQREVDEWLAWRAGVVSKPDVAFSALNSAETCRRLFAWLHQNHLALTPSWNGQVVASALSPEFARNAANAVDQLWQQDRDLLPREYNESQLSTFLTGIDSLAAFAERENWTSTISEQQAVIAAQYCIRCDNEFPRFFDSLFSNFPNSVLGVLKSELQIQLSGSELRQHSSLLHKLLYGPKTLQEKLSDELSLIVMNWPHITDGAAMTNLDHCLQILSGLEMQQDKATLITHLVKRLSDFDERQTRQSIFHALFRLEPKTAAEVLLKRYKSSTHQDDDARQDLAHLFSHRLGLDYRLVQVNEPELLANLVRWAYRIAPPQAITNDERVMGEPESARGLMLNRLLGFPGSKAYAARAELANQPEFSHFKDKLLQFSIEQAARDSEPEALSVQNIKSFLDKSNFPPVTRDQIFELMLEHVETIEHNLQHDDFSLLSTVQKADSEKDVQIYVANCLRASLENLCNVAREEDVADDKEPDIRLHSRSGEQKAVVELKLADKDWTLADYEDALRFQIVEKYLRHEHCRAGCLLIALKNKDRLWKPDGAKLCFDDLIGHLSKYARALEQEKGFTIKLAVRPLRLFNASS